MLAGRIENATAVLGAPKSWDPDSDPPCGSLPVRVEVIGELTTLVSAWFPNTDEIARMQAGAPIYLRVVGRAQPPVSLEVGDAPGVVA
jgi:hypothetical protein